MQLAHTRLPSSSTAVAPRRSRRTVVVTKALTLSEATDWVGKALVRVFTPDENKDMKWPSNNFSTRITSHHEGTKKPFKDEFVSNAALPPSSALEPTEPSAAGYVEDAVNGAVAGLRPILPEEPGWENGQPTGWKGDIHTSANKRDAREGFHTKKY